MSRQKAQPFICEARISTRYASWVSRRPVFTMAMLKSCSFFTSSGDNAAKSRRDWVWLMTFPSPWITPSRRSGLLLCDTAQRFQDALQLVGIALDVERADSTRLGGR